MSLNAKEVEELIRNLVPMADNIKLIVEEVREGYGRIRIPYHEKNTRPGGTISGPIMMSAADTAMYVSILGSLGNVAMAVTSNLNINFMKRPLQRDILAESTILKMGKRMAFCEVCIRSDGSDELVAHATGSYSLPPVQ